MRNRLREVPSSQVREFVRKELTKHFVVREFIAIYSRIAGVALIFYCGLQFEDKTLLLWVIGAHGISVLITRHFAKKVMDALERDGDYDRQAHFLACAMGVAAFLWGCFLWTFPQTLLRTPEEFIITLAVIIAIALMMLTAALHSTALRYTVLGACLSIVPAIIGFTPLSGFSPALGFTVLILILFAYTKLFERQARSLALLQLRNQRSSEKLSRVNKASLGAMGQLRMQAERDGLTKMRNRGAFEQAAAKMFPDQAEQDGVESISDTSIAVMLVDVDHFKSINDKYGHAIGDVVLEHIGSQLCDWEDGGSKRLSARWGGEEFVILAGLEKGETIEQLAEDLRLHLGIAGKSVSWPDELNISVSIGCSLCEMPLSIEQEIRTADVALYRAKNEGRDCWRIAA